MRLIMMHKADKACEAGLPPRPEMMAGMGLLIQEMVNAGVFLSAEGLQPSSKGVRLKFSGGKHTVIDGPFTESKELIAGYCIVQVKSTEEAIEWAPRFAKLVGDVEIDIRPLYERAGAS